MDKAWPPKPKIAGSSPVGDRSTELVSCSIFNSFMNITSDWVKIEEYHINLHKTLWLFIKCLRGLMDKASAS